MKQNSRIRLSLESIKHRRSLSKLEIVIKNSILLIALGIVVISCSQTVELQIDEGKQQVVLNSILDATKDTIWVEVSWSKPITDSFEMDVIENAKVLLSANGAIADTFSYFRNGLYFLNYSPCEYDEYLITAIVGTDTLTGSTRIPPIPTVSIESLKTQCGQYLAHVKTNTDDNFAYWIASSHLTYEGDRIVKRIFDYGLHANGYLLDDFSRIADVVCSLSYDYGYYLRIINTPKIEYDTIRFASGGIYKDQKAEIVVFATDCHYDRFIKSSILGENAEWVASQAPLYPGSIVYYSNVKGGLGLVGSINSKTQLFSYE
jgi:hypothetical protein